MNLDAFFAAPLLIQIHAASAIGAFGVGLVQILGLKLRLPHRPLGYLFVGLMITAASTAIFIRSHPDGGMSSIHIFIPVTLIGLFGMVRAAMRRNFRAHRINVFTLFIGALTIPGIFAFMPGRLMNTVFLGG